MNTYPGVGEPCPKCGEALPNGATGPQLQEPPTQVIVHCPHCNFRGTMVINALTEKVALHVLRNPYGHSEALVRSVRLWAADRIEAASRHQSCTKSTTPYMDTPHYRVNKFVSMVRVMGLSDREGRIYVLNDIALTVNDLEAVVRESAPLFTGECVHQVCQWQTTKPTVPGWYWSMWPGAKGPEAIKVVYLDRDDLPGQVWYGPVEPPAPYEFVACTKQEGQ